MKSSLSLILGRGAYAISVALVSVTVIACKEDGGSVSADASGSADAAVDPLDATAGLDARPDARADAGPEPLPPEVCPRPASALSVLGDVNGDGVVEIADSVALLDSVFRGGRPPPCVPATDFNGDGLTEADDATRITSLLVTGTQGPRFLRATSCNGVVPWPAGRCVPLAWDIDAPAQVSSETFSAEIAVRSATMAIDAWSMSVSATGCTVSAVSTDRTSSAEVWDTPPGLRHLGYAALKPVEGGAIAYVILSHHEDIALPAAPRTPLLRVQVTAPVPAAGCVPCVLGIDGDRKWSGKPVAPVVVSDGRSYIPATTTATISVCAP